MKLNPNYSSDISSLLDIKRNDSIFISTWNKDEEINPFPNAKIIEYNQLNSSQVSDYYFSDEFLDLKKYIISENDEFKRNNISIQNFAFVSNGTIGAWLSILAIFKEKKCVKALLLSPIYYLYIEILKQLNIEIYVESFPNNNIDQICNTILSQNINLVIINNPLFGTGICISNSDIKIIQLALLKTNGYILIDNIYNGLKWNNNILLNDFKLYNELSYYNNYVILESLAKNLFLNGIKHCAIFSNSKLINKIEKNSVVFCVSITSQQYNYIKRLYSRAENSFVKKQLSQNINYVKNTYNLILSMFAEKNVYVSKCTSGVFCLLGIPKNNFSCKDDLSIAKEILYKCNVLTLPYDRYLYSDDVYYYFRVNLMINREKLYKAIESLQNGFNI